MADFYFNPLGDTLICRILEEISNNNITYSYNQLEKELTLTIEQDKPKVIDIIKDILVD